MLARRTVRRRETRPLSAALACKRGRGMGGSHLMAWRGNQQPVSRRLDIQVGSYVTN